MALINCAECGRQMKKFFALAFFVSTFVHAGCDFQGPIAFACMSPRGAAAALMQFGFDEATASRSYNQALISEIGCGMVGPANTKAVKDLELFIKDRVATRSGWIDVYFVDLGKERFPRGHVYWIASAYLKGNCRRRAPATATVTDSVAPQQSSANTDNAQKPGWCPAAKTPVELMICADDGLSALENQMSAAYRAAESRAADKAPLLADQRAWRKQRDQCADAACIAGALQQRITQLAP